MIKLEKIKEEKCQLLLSPLDDLPFTIFAPLVLIFQVPPSMGGNRSLFDLFKKGSIYEHPPKVPILIQILYL